MAHINDSKINLAGQTAVVTGSGRGIGQAIALELVSAGARVAVIDVLPDQINENSGIN